MKILITGITGQDGSYLAEQLTAQGHEVSGLVRRTSGVEPMARLANLMRGPTPPTLYQGDLSDAGSLRRVIEAVEPEEVYHLGAQSHVGVSFRAPAATLDVTGIGTLRLLEALYAVAPKAKVYNACSSEIFGNTPGPLSEESAIAPVSPYGAAKALSLQICRQYRDRGMWIASGILFNHCSPRQAREFLPAKVVSAALAWAEYRATLAATPPGLAHKVPKPLRLTLGNLDARRDWGWAPDYTALMPRILRHGPVELVVGTGRSISVRAFVTDVFAHLDLDARNYVDEVPSDRPLEIWDLVADTSRMAGHVGLAALPSASIPRLIRQLVDGMRPPR